MERKLAEYRSKKEWDQRIQDTKEKLRGIFTVVPNSKTTLNISEETETLIDETASIVSEKSEDLNDTLDDTSLNCFTWTDYLFYGLIFLLWATLYAIFIKLQFGAIYFIVTALLGIYFNTGTKSRRKGQMSAYSVFNKNCESIDGTLKAEQLERELYYAGTR